MKKFIVLVFALVSVVNAQVFHISELSEGHPMRETRLRQIEERAVYHLNEYRKSLNLNELSFDSIHYKLANDHAKYLQQRGRIHYNYSNENTYYLSHNRGYKVNGVLIESFNAHAVYYNINPSENCSVIPITSDSVDIEKFSKYAIEIWKKSSLHNMNMISQYDKYVGLSVSYLHINIKKKNLDKPMNTHIIDRKMIYFVLASGGVW